MQPVFLAPPIQPPSIAAPVSSTCVTPAPKLTLQEVRCFLIKIGFLNAYGEPIFKAKIKPLSEESLHKLETIKSLTLDIQIDGSKLTLNQYSFVEKQKNKLNETMPQKFKLYLRGAAAIFVINPCSYICNELRSFAESHGISPEELANCIEQLTQTYSYNDVDYLLLADKSKEKIIPQKLLQSQVVQIKEHANQATYEKIEKEGLKKTLPQPHPWYPSAPECLITTLGTDANRMDLSTGRMDKLSLFSCDDLRLELSSESSLIPQSGRFWKACIDRTLKIIRLEKWHMTDFRSALAAVKYLSSGYALVETEITLAEIMKWGVNALKKENSKAQEITNVICKQLQNHQIDPKSYLFNWLLHYKLAGLPVEALKETLRPKFKNSPFIELMLDPAVPFESFANGLFALIQMLDTYNDSSGKVRKEAEDFGTPMIRLRHGNLVFAFPLTFKPFKEAPPIDLFSHFFAMDTLEHQDKLSDVTNLETPILPYLLIQLARQKKNTPLTQDFQELLKRADIALLIHLMDMLTPWLPPIQTPQELPAEYVPLITFLKSNYASIVVTKWETLIKESQGNTSLRLILFSCLASTHPHLALEIAPTDCPEELGKACQTIVEIKRKLNAKMAFDWWLSVCLKTPLPNEEEMAESLLAYISKDVELFKQLYSTPRFGKSLVQKIVQQILAGPLSIQTLKLLSSIKNFIPTTFELPLELVTSLFDQAKKLKLDQGDVLILDIVLSMPTCLAKLKLTETSATQHKKQVPAMGEWIYLLFRANLEKEGKQAWTLYLSRLDPLYHAQEARFLIKRLGNAYPDVLVFCCSPLDLKEKDVLFDSILKEKRKNFSSIEIFEWWGNLHEVPNENELPLTSVTLKKIRNEVESLSTKKGKLSPQAASQLLQQAVQEKRFQDALKLYLSKFKDTIPDNDPLIVELLEKVFLETPLQDLLPWHQDKNLLKKLLALPAFKPIAEKIISFPVREGFFAWLQALRPLISNEAYTKALHKIVESDSLSSTSEVLSELIDHKIYTPIAKILRYLELATLTPALMEKCKAALPGLLELSKQDRLLRFALSLFIQKLSIKVTPSWQESCLNEFQYELANSKEKAQLLQSYFNCIQKGIFPLSESHVEVIAALFQNSNDPAPLLEAAKPLCKLYSSHPSFNLILEQIGGNPDLAMPLIQELDAEKAYSHIKNKIKGWPVKPQLELFSIFVTPSLVESCLLDLLNTKDLSQPQLMTVIKQIDKFEDCNLVLLKTIFRLSLDSQEVLSKLLPVLFRWRLKHPEMDKEFNIEMNKALLCFEQTLEVWEPAIPFLDSFFSCGSVYDELILLIRLLDAFASNPIPLIPYFQQVVDLKKRVPSLKFWLEWQLISWILEYDSKVPPIDRVSMACNMVLGEIPEIHNMSGLAISLFNVLKKYPEETKEMVQKPVFEQMLNKLLRRSISDKALDSFLNWLADTQVVEGCETGIKCLYYFKESLLPILCHHYPFLLENLIRQVTHLDIHAIMQFVLEDKIIKEKFDEQKRVSLQVENWKKIPFFTCDSTCDIMTEAQMSFDFNFIAAYGRFCTDKEYDEAWAIITHRIFVYLKLEKREDEIVRKLLFTLLACMGVEPQLVFFDKMAKGQSLTMSDVLEQRSKLKKQIPQADLRLSKYLEALIKNMQTSLGSEGLLVHFLDAFIIDFFEEHYEKGSQIQKGIYFPPLKLLLERLFSLPATSNYIVAHQDLMSLLCTTLPGKWFTDAQRQELRTKLIKLFPNYCLKESDKHKMLGILYKLIFQTAGVNLGLSYNVQFSDMCKKLVSTKETDSDRLLVQFMDDLFQEFVDKVPPSHPNFKHFITECVIFLTQIADGFDGELKTQYLNVVSKVAYSCFAIEPDLELTKLVSNLYLYLVKMNSTNSEVMLELTLLLQEPQCFSFNGNSNGIGFTYGPLLKNVQKLMSLHTIPAFLKAIDGVKIRFSSKFSHQDPVFQLILQGFSFVKQSSDYRNVLEAFTKWFENDIHLERHVKYEYHCLALDIISASAKHLNAYNVRKDTHLFAYHVHLIAQLCRPGFISDEKTHALILDIPKSQNIHSFEEEIRSMLSDLTHNKQYTSRALKNGLYFISLGRAAGDLNDTNTMPLIELHFDYAIQVYRTEGITNPDHMKVFFETMFNPLNNKDELLEKWRIRLKTIGTLIPKQKD